MRPGVTVSSGMKEEARAPIKWEGEKEKQRGYKGAFHRAVKKKQI